MSSAFLIMTVQMAEPARTNRLARMAAEVDRKKVQVRLNTPLGNKGGEPRPKIDNGIVRT